MTYIKRADAIGAVRDYFEHYSLCQFVIDDIKALPSADVVEGDGRYENAIKKLREMPRYLNGVKAKQIKKIPSDAVQEWRIGKPTEQGEYMVTLDSFGHKLIDLFYYGKPMMPNRKVRGKCWYRSDDEWGDVVYDDTDILAWMPLPKPYKGGDTE